MNKRHLLTGFMFLLCTYTAFAQQVEVKKDSIGRAVHLPPEQKQLLNMDKDGFVLPDMNVAPNDRKATIQADSIIYLLHNLFMLPGRLPDWELLSILSVVTIIVRIYSGLMQTAI